MFNEGSSLALDHKCQPMKGVPLQRKFQLGLMISCFYPFQMYDIHENRNNESSRDLSRVQIGLELIVCKVGGGGQLETHRPGLPVSSVTPSSPRPPQKNWCLYRRHTLTYWLNHPAVFPPKLGMVLVSHTGFWCLGQLFVFTTVWYLDLITWQQFIPKIGTYFTRCCQFDKFLRKHRAYLWYFHA